MKKRIICGLCLLFTLMSVIVLLPLSAAAQSGHGGSTQVIARVEPSSGAESMEPSDEASGEQSRPQGDESVLTGEAAGWVIGSASAAAALSLGLMLLVIKRNEKNENRESEEAAGEAEPPAE